MAYITPNTDLYVLYDVPLDTTYEHSLYFTSPSAQETYFRSKIKYTFSNLTYQRENRGYIRVEKNAEDLYDANYIMFRNTAFGTKWFYAFITNVTYVSNNVSQIDYVIDALQTWMFEFTFNSCFIERMHTPTDEIGEHYEPEPLPVGEYVLNNYAMVDPSLAHLGVVVATVEVDQGSAMGNMYEGLYSGAKLYYFRIDTGSERDILNSFMARFVTTPDNLAGVYMVPEAFVQSFDDTQGQWPVILPSETCFNENVLLPQLSVTDTLDGYTPRNKKLYTYPYNFLHVDNGGNGELSLRYEFFDQMKPKLEINGSCLEPVQALLIPVNYKGVSGEYSTGNLKVYNPESLALLDYPTCSWDYDSYRQWKNTQGVVKGIRQIGKVANTIVSAGTNALSDPKRAAGSEIEMGGGLIGGTISYITEMISGSYQASLAADICKGSTSNGNINCGRKRQNYYYGRCSVNKLSAEMIDTFFDKYGYAVNKVDMPNLAVRSIWTYVKTRDCTIIGNVPANEARLICSIFNRGITFWKDASKVGRYDLADQNMAPLG